MADISVNSTGILQMVTTFNAVVTTMDTASFILYNPNLTPVVGPIAPTLVSTGVYQYALPIGTLTLPGTWTHTWYIQRGAESLQDSFTFTVGL